MEKRMSDEGIAVLVLTTFIFMVGFVSNVMIIIIIIRHKRMHTVTNWFVLNLAICDLIIILCILPLNQLVPYIGWPFGATACKYIVPTLEHFAGVCVLTHTCLSAARYVGIKYSLRGKDINLTSVGVIVIAVWVISFLTMSSTLMGLMGESHLLHGMYCQIHFKSFSHRIGYRIMVFTLTYFIPMTSTGVSYFKLHRMVRKNMQSLRNQMSDSLHNRRRMQSRRINRILVTMYIAFGMTTLPIQIVYFINDFGSLPMTYPTRLLLNACLILFYAQVVTNPVVLLYMGADYRKEAYRLLTCSSNGRKFSQRTLLSRLSSNRKAEHERKESSTSRCIQHQTMKDQNNNKHDVMSLSSLKSNTPTAEHPLITDSVNENFSLQQLTEFTESENETLEITEKGNNIIEEMISRPSSDVLNISAYYDNGSLMYFYDPIFGQVSLASDDGRETDL